MPPGQRPALPHNICRIAVTGDVGGQPFANIFYIETDEPGIDSAAGVEDMLGAFAGKLASSGLITLFHSSLHVTGMQGVVQLTPDTAVSSQVVQGTNGAAAGTVLTPNDAAVISWLSGAYWRGGKPRTYISGLTSTMIDTNHSLNDTFKNSVISAAGSLRSGVNSITTPAVDKSTMGFVSYASGKVWRTTPLFLPFTGVTVHDRVGSQRRRLGPWLR